MRGDGLWTVDSGQWTVDCGAREKNKDLKQAIRRRK